MTDELHGPPARTAEAAERVSRELLAFLPLLTRVVGAAVRREAGEDTTMPQFRVLALLAEGPQNVSGLARHRRVSLQSMGTLVQALVERGWVDRRADPADRRQHALTLTAAGRAHYERAQARLLDTLTPALETLDDDALLAVQVALPALYRALIQTEDSHGEHTPD
jgi:DNA-binding MarR family transcriptional regulator